MGDVGSCELIGRDERDLLIAEAYGWYSLSAGQGSSRAKYHLGDFYDRGIVVTKDAARARQLMTEAAADGDSDAIRWLSTH